MAEFRGGRLEKLVLNPQSDNGAAASTNNRDNLLSHQGFRIITQQMPKSMAFHGDQAVGEHFKFQYQDQHLFNIILHTQKEWLIYFLFPLMDEKLLNKNSELLSVILG